MQGGEFGERTRCHESQTSSLPHNPYGQELIASTLMGKPAGFTVTPPFKCPNHRKQSLLEALLCILKS